MLFDSPLKKDKKKLNSYYKEQDRLQKQYEELVDEGSCSGCSQYFTDRTDTYAERFLHCGPCRQHEKVTELCRSLDSLLEEIDRFIENEYAKDVFDFYSKKKPVLVRNKTGEVFSWEDAFGQNFDNVSEPLRHSLVGLENGWGRYSFR